MVKNTKAAKSASKKKSGSRKAKTRRGKNVSTVWNKLFFAAADTVFVVSSIALRAGFKTAFENGLKHILPGMNVDFTRENLGYKQADIEAAVAQLNSNPSVALIATVGGLVTYQAANAVANRPFISLVGARPAGDSEGSMFFGGVNLQSFRMNTLRIEYLEEKGFARPEVGLLLNPNSTMAPREENRWKGAKPVVKGGVNSNGQNDAGAYPGNFRSFPSGIKAIVISADPFFQKTRNELVSAANADGRYIVYPLQNYEEATPPPTAGKASLYGPKLRAPYRLLGQCAAIVLQTNSPLDPKYLFVEDETKDL